jgi:hypothetical protein
VEATGGGRSSEITRRANLGLWVIVRCHHRLAERHAELIAGRRAEVPQDHDCLITGPKF